MVSSASRVGSINVLLQVQMGQASAGLNTFANTVERTGVRTQRSVTGIDRSVSGMNRTMGRVNGRGFTVLTLGALRAKNTLDQLRGTLLATSALFGGLIPAALGASMVRVADRAHRMSNDLRTVTKDTEDLKNTQEALFQVSQRSRASFEATTKIYARTARATEYLGLSQAKLLRMTETIQKSFAVGGASTAEAWGAAIQLSQGIASNRFSGDEFRSVAENAPVLLKGMADSMGVTIGKIREMAHAGELTAGVVVKAIIDASQDIDAAFEKTTSTIGQAFVKVDNAIVKYVGDSDKVTVSSNAIVTVLNALSSNIDTVADSLLLLGGGFAAVLGGRGANRLRGWASDLRTTRIEALAAAHANEALAVAEMKTARAEMVSRRLAFNRALTEGNLTAKQMSRQQKAVAASVATYNTRVARAALATEELAAAQRAASVSGRAMAAAGRVASGAWAFIGGPFGAALLGIGAVMYGVSRNAAAAQEMADDYAEAIKKAGEESKGAAGGIRKAATELANAAEAAGAAAMNVRISKAQEQFASGIDRMRLAADSLRGSLDVFIGFGSEAFSPLAAEVDKLITKFESGELSAEELRSELDRIASTNPDNSAILERIQEIGDQADAARGRVEGLVVTLQEALKKLSSLTMAFAGEGEGGRRDRLSSSALSDDKFNSRFGQPYAKDWKELFPDFYKPEKRTRAPRKTANDRFDNDIQRTRDRIADMQEEQAALRLTYKEEQRRKTALDLTQTALRQVREEARRKGDQDWQNAQLTPEMVKQIDDASAAYADQADALRKVQDEMELRRDIIRGVFGDITSALEDGKITAQEWGDVLINVLDKVISKIEDDLADALAKAFSNSGGPGGGGGILGGIFGGLFGGGGKGINYFPPAPSGPVGLFDSGGVRLGSNIIPFGPKTRKIGNAVLADSGFGVRHFPAILEQGEAVLSGRDMGRTMDVISAATSQLKDGGPRAYNDNRVYHIDARGAQRGVGAEIRDALEEYDRKQLPLSIARVNADPRKVG